MIWTAPWVWFGLAALAVPVLVHLLARHASRPLPFPTLRFLRATPLVDVRRRRISDLLLLAVRCAIVALAVAALAQPHRASSAPAAVNRIVVTDISDSVDVAAARRAAAAQADGADAFAAIERRDLRGAIVEATAWLAARPGLNTIAIVSDFQRGAIDADALAAIAATAGVRTQRVAMREHGGAPVHGVAAWSVDGPRTRATWADAVSGGSPFAIEGGDAGVAAAVVDAAMATSDAAAGALRPVTFVLPVASGRAALLERSAAIDQPWMFDVFSAIGASAETARVADGRLTIFLSSAEPARVAEAVRRAIPRLGLPVAELETSTLADAELQAIEREPAPAPAARQAAEWAGRWFWIAALVLLGVEALIRRPRRVADHEEVARAA